MNSIASGLEIGQNLIAPEQCIPVTVTPVNTTSEQEEDEFVTHLENTQDVTEKPSFFTKLVQETVSTARDAWKVVRQYNPITRLFNKIEERTISGLVEKAKNRNGAISNEELTNYHRSIEHKSNNPNAIFSFQKSINHHGGQRHLVIISNGHLHDFNTPERLAGLNGLVKRFLDAGCDVLTVRSGTVSHELWNRFGVESPLHPKVVETDVGNLIEDAFKGTGIFKDSDYKKFSAVCYSMGAGSIQNNMDRLKNILTTTVYIDPVEHRAYGIASEVKERPEHSGRHCHFGQGNSYFVNARIPTGLRTGDKAVQIETSDICHTSIDNHPQVLNGAFEFVMNRIRS